MASKRKWEGLRPFGRARSAFWGAANARNLGAGDDASAMARNSSLSQAMRRVLLEGQSSCDMVFVCAPGGVDDEVPAWRMLVAMRSPFLEKLLLKWNTAEASSARVHLPGIESDTMRICLEFFYTASVQRTSWPKGSIFLPMQVIAASHFFLVDELQEVTIPFLLSTTAWMRYRHGIEDGICARLAASPELLQEIVAAFNLGVRLEHIRSCDNLRRILKRLGRVIDVGLLSCGRLDFHKYVSRDAMLHLLERQTVSWGDLCMWEYGRLQHIVHWCVYEYLQNNDNPVAEEAVIQRIVNHALPWEYKGGIDNIVLAKSLSDGPSDPATQAVMEALAVSVQSMLSVAHIYFEDIPSIILSLFIDPLAIVPASTLTLAHELRAIDKWEDLRWDDHPANEGVRIDENVIEFSCNTDQFFGVSPCNLCHKFPEVTMLAWEVRILNGCKFLRVGFGLSRLRTERFDGDNEGFWSLCSFGVLLCSGEKRHCKGTYYEGSIIKVQVDLHNKVCSFLINGIDVGAICGNLPLNGRVHPAIYMRRQGKVRVQFLC